VKRNSIVLSIVLAVLALLGWAGWANFEFRKQAAERSMATMAHGVLVPDAQTGAALYVSPLVGKPAPAFTLDDLNGKKVSLADYKGTALLINFWATWCAPCRIETPWIVELRNKYAREGFEVLGISADDLDPTDKQRFNEAKHTIQHTAIQLQIPYPVLLNADSISTPYGGLDSLPTSFFVDRKGIVTAAQMGLTSKQDIERNIRKALGK